MEEFDFDAWVEGLKAIPEELLMKASAKLSDERRERPARAAEDKARAEIVAGLAETAPDLVQAHVTLEEAKADPSKVPVWKNPGADFLKASRQGGVVKHADKYWLSETETLNVWEPGAEGVNSTVWRDVTHEVMPPAPVTDESGNVIAQGSAENPFPFVAGIQVKAGQYVNWNGTVYRVLQGHTLADHWAPDAAHSLFSKA
ncbi:carbohydrate-binding protein [Corynebacterium axilliensis]|uniref:carbohydrate-binding protein n=1 Tax=Corynebacterium sp. YSMAA5_1_F9 TaxID=3383591 RepID=UPI0038CF5D2D